MGTRCVGAPATPERGGARAVSRNRRSTSCRRHDFDRRCHGCLLSSADTRSAIGDRGTYARRRVGWPSVDTTAPRTRRRDRTRHAPGRTAALHRDRADGERAAADCTNRGRTEPAARPSAFRHFAERHLHRRVQRPSIGAGRDAIGAPRAAAGHSPSGGGARRRERADWRRPSRVFPAHCPHRLPGRRESSPR